VRDTGARASRWAAAFVNAAGDRADKNLEALKALAVPVKELRGDAAGRSAALRLEKMIREAAGGNGAPEEETEIAVRFITLLVEKHFIRQIDPVIQEIERILEGRRGILTAVLESAFPRDADFERTLEKEIMARTGAAGVQFETLQAPELLDGYRLRISGETIDASLRAQLRQMQADLGNAD
jgi:F0F1-type ATP synthase delta subunit